MAGGAIGGQRSGTAISECVSRVVNTGGRGTSRGLLAHTSSRNGRERKKQKAAGKADLCRQRL